jgi:hypothetical protein
VRAGFGTILGAVAALVLASAAWLRDEPARDLARREAAWGFAIAPGDLVFQDLDCGPRCDLISQVTRSRYVHVGVVLREADGLAVWEALGPVGPVPLAAWVARGVRGRVAVHRLKLATSGELEALGRAVRARRGRPYDADYQWDDARIYCSELIAKAFVQATGRACVEPHPVGREALGAWADRVRVMSHGRLTAATLVVTPADLARSSCVERRVDELR